MPAKIRRLHQGPHTDEELREYGLMGETSHELFRADKLDGFVPHPGPPPVPAFAESPMGISVREHPLAALHRHPELLKPWSRYDAGAPLDVTHDMLDRWSALHVQAWRQLVAAHQRKRDAESAPPPDDAPPPFLTAGGATL